MKRLILLVMATVAIGFAQDINGNIAGVVTDESGAVVPNAVVTAVNTATSARFTANSNQEGQYAVRTIPVGVYDLTAEAPGFRKYEAKGIRLQLNETARVDIPMKVGATAEFVVVSATAVSVDTTTAVLEDGRGYRNGSKSCRSTAAIQPSSCGSW